MSIQAWHTLVRLEYKKCNFPPEVDDRLQRDIFVIGLNDSFRRFRSDIICHEDLTSLTFAKSSPKHVILRPAFKPSLLSLSNILKKQPTKSYPLKTDQKSFLVLLDVQSLLPLDKLTPKLAFGVDVRPILLVVPALLRMTHVMPVENVDNGNRYARRLLSKLYLMWNRILTPTFFNPLSSRMMSVKSHLHRKVSLLTLTSVLLHHHLSSASSFRLPQAARATPCMSQTLTNYLQCQ